MAQGDAMREKLLSLLSHQPRQIVDGMITITEATTTQRSGVDRSPKPTASLGGLDTLPLELLYQIFSVLDLRSLSHITRTCLRGIATVESHPEYRDLMRYAPVAVTALGLNRVLTVHSTATLHATLCSTACSSCGEYGAFLHLLTSERCCYGCLWRNQSLWAIPIAEARKCFDLSADSVKALPVLRRVPGKYYVGHNISRSRSTRLVSVKSAKELALKQGKTEQDLAAILDAHRPTVRQILDYHTLRWLQAAPLQPPSPRLAMQPSGADIPNDKFCGMASVPFPSLSASKRAETGLWCLGCEKACREWSANVVNAAVAQWAVAGGDSDVQRALHRLERVARSEADFFEHLKHCPGAKEMQPDLEGELERI
ncbi:hypothetical protein LTR53_000314 [Teratosphaeriaceae sp. CCFEE 6253]|nr:hypothetical protein LTR53_000314 [Teratosphaeriaceae sp. CCFEE 6253]